MSLYDQARADNRGIMTRKDGLTLEMTLTNQVGDQVPVRGRVVEPGLEIDPTTGLPVIAENTLIAFYASDVASIAGIEKILVTNFYDSKGGRLRASEIVTDNNGDQVFITGTLEEEKYKDWTVSFTTPGGEAKFGRLQMPIMNKTLGYVQSQLIKKVS